MFPARVLAVNPEEERLQLSFILDPNDKRSKAKASMKNLNAEAFAKARPGAVYSATVTHVGARAINVKTEGGLMGFVPVTQLCDHASLAESVLQSFQVRTCSNAMIPRARCDA